MGRQTCLAVLPLACSLGLVCASAQQQLVETAAPFSLPAAALLKAAAEAQSPAGTDVVVLLEETRQELDPRAAQCSHGVWYSRL